MLEIESSKGKFQINPGTKIPFVQDFNLHDFEAAKDVKTWRWKLPKTPSNIELMDFYGLADAPQQESFIQVSVYVFSKLWRTGPLYLLDEDDDNYDVSFAGEMGILLNIILDKKINEFDYAPIQEASIHQYALDTVNDAIGTHPCVFAPIDLPSLRGDVWWPAQINSVVVDSNGDFAGFPQFWRTFEADEYEPDKIAIPSTSIGYLAGSFVKFEGLYYTNPNNINSNRSPTTHPAEWTQALDGNVKRYNPMVPQFYVFNILHTIATQLGINISGEIFDVAELQRMTFFNVHCVNTFVEGEPYEILPNTDILPGNHLPDITLREFLKELAKLFNQRVIYRAHSNVLYFENRTNILDKLPQQLLRRKMISFTTKFSEQRVYNLSYKFRSGDVNYATPDWAGTLEGIDNGVGATNISSQCSTLPMRSGFTEVDINHTEFPGDDDNSWFPGLMFRPVSGLSLQSETPLQFLIYRGKAAYNNPNRPASWPNIPLIPHLSSGLQFTIAPSTDIYTLYWQGAGGLHETYYKKYLKALSMGKVLDTQLVLDAETFHLFDELAPQALGEFVCLVEELEFSLSTTSDHEIAKAQVLRL